ncbi:hypothetical protein C8R46DRAFT_1361295 [Mycena filopes]|nr:hypothetical protein C8R46DRAFT_1361295 [Mycena filopes]
MTPALPPELECTIFELAARDRSSPQILVLFLVARRVKEWVEPFLWYRTVLLPPNPDGFEDDGFPRVPPDDFIAALTTKPRSFFESTVRHLFIPENATASDIGPILTVCRGVTVLLAACNLRPHLELLTPFTFLRRLSLHLVLLFPSPHPVDFRAIPIFAAITHLEILDRFPDAAFALEVCERIGDGIPHLTHLAFHSAAFCVPFARYIQRTLRCLVLRHRFDSIRPPHQAAEAMRPDQRFVCIAGWAEYEGDWLREVNRGDGCWGRADAFLAAKAAMKVSRSEYRIKRSGKWVERVST